MPAHLNRKQQREIKAVVERAKKDNGVPQTAQQSIPFQRMFPDGICRVTDSYYTKTIQFQDINYQLAQQEDKTAIFDEWCSFLNFFDSSIHFELSFMNMGTDAESFEKSVRIPFKKDEFNPVRAEYSQMLKKQLAQGNNGLTKTKYLTFGIEAESMRQAKPRLAHIENDLLNNFRRLGVIATPMDGKERLRLMHAMFHMGDDDKFFFDWKWLVESGLSVKDFIAPTAFAFKGNRTFQMGSLYGSMSFLSITASDLSDRMLADFLDMESSQIVTMHMLQARKRTSMSVIEMGKRLGLGKTESYWLIKKNYFQTIMVGKKMRVMIASFEDWYANQCRYHKIDGTPPGAHIKEISMTADELGNLLGISEASAYELIAKGHFEKVDDLAKMRITKESFWKWYTAQTFYRTVEDQAEDKKLRQDAYTMPEIGKMLGLYRNQVYYIVSKGVFDIVQIGRYKCVTKDSFHRWYESQSHYKMVGKADMEERSE